jgi:hypothetical protein
MTMKEVGFGMQSTGVRVSSSEMNALKAAKTALRSKQELYTFNQVWKCIPW